ncbi:acyl-CoA dehydrogenase [Salipiger aestuarii]|nr:acyl-CoA dehydrogenase [Salipiger aestuarii]
MRDSSTHPGADADRTAGRFATRARPGLTSAEDAAPGPTRARVRDAAAGIDACAPRALARRLRDTGKIDLSLARLLEGHVNAIHLIDVHGDDHARLRLRADLDAGMLYGVWGADATPPVCVREGQMHGVKCFASGLGVVDRAIVTVGRGETQRLYVVDATDPARHDLAAWNMSGMQASRSGRFDCGGLRGEPLGPLGCYTAEPHFVGGTWRIAAVALGGAVGLLDRCADVLRARDQIGAEAHMLRLAPVALRIVSAWPAILRAAQISTGPEGASHPDRAAVLSVSMRLLSEELGQDCIRAAERSVGLSMFADDDTTGRHARDLACYLRQARRDAFLLQAGSAMLEGAGGMSEWLDDHD